MLGDQKIPQIPDGRLHLSLKTGVTPIDRQANLLFHCTHSLFELDLTLFPELHH